MTLTKFSDYSLRLLIYLGLHDDRLVSVGEVSRAYRVSPHIMVKVVQLLVRAGTGGQRSRAQRRPALEQSRPPRSMWAALCGVPNRGGIWWSASTRTATRARSTASAVSKGVLKRAQRAFLDVLDDHTLADFLPRAPALTRLIEPVARSTSMNQPRMRIHLINPGCQTTARERSRRRSRWQTSRA